jgi:hypothetical protein
MFPIPPRKYNVCNGWDWFMSLDVSVVMPARNAGKFVRLAVISTLLALPESSELIVVNDGSTDNTLSIISSIRDRRLRILNGPGKGLVSALNLGLAASKGIYVARMDADDICLPWRFAAQLRKMTSNSDLDFLFSTAIAFGKPLRPFYVVPQLAWGLNPLTFQRVLKRRNPAVHPTMFARATALKSLGGYHDCPAEDEELWLRASLHHHKLARIGIPGIALRLHSGQTTRQVKWKTSLKNDSQVPLLRSQLLATAETPALPGNLLFRILDFFDANGFASIGLIVKKIQRIRFQRRRVKNVHDSK